MTQHRISEVREFGESVEFRNLPLLSDPLEHDDFDGTWLVGLSLLCLMFLCGLATGWVFFG